MESLIMCFFNGLFVVGQQKKLYGIQYVTKCLQYTRGQDPQTGQPVQGLSHLYGADLPDISLDNCAAFWSVTEQALIDLYAKATGSIVIAKPVIHLAN